jgi:hypothetical protein
MSCIIYYFHAELLAPPGLTTSHPAVMATRPAKAPFKESPNDGLLYRIQDIIMAVTVPAAAERFVVTNIEATAEMLSNPLAANCEPGLKPNHPNHRMNTPRAPIVKL